MKYELTDNFIIHKNVKLFQIKALKDFGDIKAGDLGGFIETTENLNQQGEAWIDPDSKVFGGSVISGNSNLIESEVFGNSSINNSVIIGSEICYSEISKASIFDSRVKDCRIFANHYVENSKLYKCEIRGDIRIEDCRFKKCDLVDGFFINCRMENVKSAGEVHFYDSRVERSTFNVGFFISAIIKNDNYFVATTDLIFPFGSLMTIYRTKNDLGANLSGTPFTLEGLSNHFNKESMDNLIDLGIDIIKERTNG